ncbi:hypothetical protein TOPH_05004 [Tolypocladium ophioglossoides CBS 100239]|uniref:Uncharacterized protein n=1 Tax=Tolypocladium ophioglossoides (strain CBS 100239) TaxID=1163406 RepID=A0A0L0N8T9_TOLOC|nr:hypothetical protein TOPH_05004 [Tolypocladium ophioglossoides CBS 100239]
MARLARGDINMPNFNGFPIHSQATEVQFEAATYELLRSEPNIFVSDLLYCASRCSTIAQTRPPPGCCRSSVALLRKIKPKILTIPVTPTPEFYIALFTSKIKATIKNIGNMIGRPYDCGSQAVHLRLIPYIIPAVGTQTSLYRLVLDHGDFCIHNMSIEIDISNQPLVTSLYDREIGCIVPAILSDPRMAVIVDLVIDEVDDVPFMRRQGNVAKCFIAKRMRRTIF